MFYQVPLLRAHYKEHGKEPKLHTKLALVLFFFFTTLDKESAAFKYLQYFYSKLTKNIRRNAVPSP